MLAASTRNRTPLYLGLAAAGMLLALLLAVALWPDGVDDPPLMPGNETSYLRDAAPNTDVLVVEVPSEEVVDEVEVEVEDSQFVHEVDSRTFLTQYADSVLLDNLDGICDVAPPDDAIIVAPDGKDGSPGTIQAPLASINEAIDRVKPGQSILVRGGDYYEEVKFSAKNGSPDAWITLRSYPGERAKLIADIGWNAVAVRSGSSYINIACMEMAGPTQRPEAQPSNPNENRERRLQGQGAEEHPANYGVGVNIGDQADTREGNNPHHVRVIANEVYDFAEAGISATETSHVSIAGNTTYRNSKYGCYAGSGISIGFMVNVGGGNNPDGYSNYVVGNVSYANENISHQCFADEIGATLTDGNGIIVDLNNRSDYKGRTLVADNLTFGNGGRGVMVFKSNHVDVANNVGYHNAYSDLFGDPDGHPEFAVRESSDVRVYNNIAVPAPGNKPFSETEADVEVVANVFSDAGPGDDLFQSPSTDPESADFALQPTAVESVEPGAPFLTAVTADGLLTTPTTVGPIFNSGD